MQMRSIRSLKVMVLIGAAIFPLSSAHAGSLVLDNSDRNFWIAIDDTLARERSTWILYRTYPDSTQAHAREECTTNLHVLEVESDLSEPKNRPVVENFCGNSDVKGTLLSDGDVVVVAQNNVESWRPGNGKVSSWKYTDVVAEHPLPEKNQIGASAISVQRNGNLIIAANLGGSRNDLESPSVVLSGVTQNGKLRWQALIDEPGVVVRAIESWATDDGGALIHASAKPTQGSHIPGAPRKGGMNVMGQSRLYRVSGDGRLSGPIVIAADQMPDFSNPQAIPNPVTDPEGFRALVGKNGTAGFGSYQYGQLVAYPRGDGRVDMLLGRGTRQTRFLQIGREGSVLQDVTLDDTLRDEGLNRWTDFDVAGNDLLVFGPVSLKAVRLAQGYTSRITLPGKRIVTRMAPLSALGRKEAEAARDEELQYLQHNPSQTPMALASVGNRPLMISQVYRYRKMALQLDEATEQLAVYTEHRDALAADAAKEAERQARKLQREASQERMQADMAAAAGMSTEEFAKLSKRQQKEALVLGGNVDVLMESAAREAAIMQQHQATQSAGGAKKPSAQDMNAQMAAAMAQAQQQMQALRNDPNIPKAQKAQMLAMMQQIQQGVAGVAPPAAPATHSGELLKLDAYQRGFLEYENPEKSSTTLVIADRQSGEELLRKEYADGSVYEFIDFSSYQRPLGQISVSYYDANERLLKELTPAVGN